MRFLANLTRAWQSTDFLVLENKSPLNKIDPVYRILDIEIIFEWSINKTLSNKIIEGCFGPP